MDTSIYNFLVFSLAIILVVSSIYLFWLKNTNDKKYREYFVSRHLIAFSFLFLSLQCFLLSIYDIRSHNKILAIAMNITSYDLVTSLLYFAYMNLLYPRYMNKKNIVIKACMSLFIISVAWISVLQQQCFSSSFSKELLIFAGVIAFFDLLFMVIRFMIIYQRINKNISNYCYDNINVFSAWMYRSALFAACVGVICVPLSFLSRDIILILVVSAILLVTYVCSSCINYLLNYPMVVSTLTDMQNEISGNSLDMASNIDNSLFSTMSSGNQYSEEEDAIYCQFAVRLRMWIDEKQYLTPDINIEKVVSYLATNRTYFSYQLNAIYGCTFRSFINNLRIEYAKEYFISNPETSVDVVAMISGYKSRTHFIKIFKEVTGMTPSEWRRCQ